MAGKYSHLALSIAEIYYDRDELLGSYPPSEHREIWAWSDAQVREIESLIHQDHFYDDRNPWVGSVEGYY